MRHPHADILHAYAEGAEIEWFDGQNWKTTPHPPFAPTTKYRIKPQEKPWYENIPSHGVLCWVSDTTENPDENSAIAIVMHKSNVYVTHKPSTWTYATPLTNDEIKQFLRGEK